MRAYRYKITREEAGELMSISEISENMVSIAIGKKANEENKKPETASKANAENDMSELLKRNKPYPDIVAEQQDMDEGIFAAVKIRGSDIDTSMDFGQPQKTDYRSSYDQSEFMRTVYASPILPNPPKASIKKKKKGLLFRWFHRKDERG